MYHDKKFTLTHETEEDYIFFNLESDYFKFTFDDFSLGNPKEGFLICSRVNDSNVDYMGLKLTNNLLEKICITRSCFGSEVKIELSQESLNSLLSCVTQAKRILEDFDAK